MLSSSVWLDSVICVVKSKHSDTVRDDENAVLCSVQHYRLDPGIKEWAELEWWKETNYPGIIKKAEICKKKNN